VSLLSHFANAPDVAERSGAFARANAELLRKEIDRKVHYEFLVQPNDF